MSAPGSFSAPRAAAADDEEPLVCRQNCDWRFKSTFKRAAHERKCRLGIEPGRKPLRKAIDRKMAGKAETENLADQTALFAMSTPPPPPPPQQQQQQQAQQQQGGGGQQQQQQQQQQQTQQQAQQQQGGGAQQSDGEGGTSEVQEQMEEEEEDKMEVDEDEDEMGGGVGEDEDEMDVDEEGEGKGKAQDEQKVAREQLLAQVVVKVGAAGAPGGEQTVEVKVEDANSGAVFTFSLADDAWLVFE